MKKIVGLVLMIISAALVTASDKSLVVLSGYAEHQQKIIDNALLLAKAIDDSEVNTQSASTDVTNIARANLKSKINKELNSLYTNASLSSRLEDVSLWMATLVAGVKSPNGKQLIADIRLVQPVLDQSLSLIAQDEQGDVLNLTGLVGNFESLLTRVAANNKDLEVSLAASLALDEQLEISLNWLASLLEGLPTARPAKQNISSAWTELGILLGYKA